MDSSSGDQSKLATAKTVLSAAASLAATVMVARSIAHEYLPHEFQGYFFSKIRKFFSRFSSQMTIVIDEFDGLVSNEIYLAAHTYLGNRITPSTQRLHVSKPEKEKNFTLKMERNEEMVDVYQGVKFRWVLICQKESVNFHNPYHGNSTLRSEFRSFEVSFPKNHKEMILESYLPYIVNQAKHLAQEKKTLKIFTVDYERIYGNLGDAWRSVNLDHPATFDTLALDTQVKDTILKDLESFVKRRDYYRKVGKAWKRGYLLYGPPGTGKSSLIAAMANYLNFDVYDLELSDLRSNSELRRLLVATANRSILVVEDIDCTIELQDRFAKSRVVHSRHYPPEKQVTLSGFLNFTDGLWSSCGDERIIVFTTNHKEKLDPAMLRPGRMDVHIHMSYCSPCGFRTLASNYLGVEDHKLFGEIEELIGTTEVTPAEVAEQLMRSDEPETVLDELIEFLVEKKKENEEAKAAKAQEKSPSIDEQDQQSVELDNEENLAIMFSTKDMPSPSSLFSAYASLATSMMLVRSMANELIPLPIRSYLLSSLSYFFKPHSPCLTLVIEESTGIARNQVYDASEAYLCTKVSPSTERLRISKTQKEKHLTIKLEKGEKIVDHFEGVEIKWRYVCAETEHKDSYNPIFHSRSERRSFELSFHKKHKHTILESYVPYILDRAKAIREEVRVLKMYTLNNSQAYGGGGVMWESINLEHPATFETLAMEPESKNAVIEDLNRFVKRKDFYKRVGRAWKRGYLLYGPPGTGKSSLVAAMANYLKFDVYDLQLGNIMRDSDLRRLLLATGNRSILVIEDIDCSVDLPERRPAPGDGRKPQDVQASHKEILFIQST
ncbi:hypothetical protein Tsubulata_000328, partial [Turnera subulata]